MLLQMDGSPHPWLEDRGPEFTLLLAIDDATGTVPYALFRAEEDTLSYLELLKAIISRYGLPLGVYTDRHTVFRTAKGPANGTPPPTQFGRALRELGITHVLAHSPEAKGRVERANGTFQDRLVTELRLSGASTMTEANVVLQGFLPRFNERFGVPPAQPGKAYRPLTPELDLDGVLCLKERRRVRRDNTVQYRQRSLQLFPDAERTSYARAHVEIQERLDGQILACYQGKILTPRDAPPLAATLRAQAGGLGYPAMWQEPPPHEGGGWRRRHRMGHGPFTGDIAWWKDPIKKAKHMELTRAGMERAKEAGRSFGVLYAEEREGFAENYALVLPRLKRREITQIQAAKELGISALTLRRIIRGRQPPTKRAAKAEEHAVLVA